jgi:hypothetical protein
VHFNVVVAAQGTPKNARRPHRFLGKVEVSEIMPLRLQTIAGIIASLAEPPADFGNA